MKRRQKPIYSKLSGIEIEPSKPESQLSPPDPVIDSPADESSDPGYFPENDFSSPDLLPAAAGDAPESLEGKVLPAPSGDLRLSTATFDFGKVFIGQQKNWEITICNDGEGSLVIESLERLPSNGFSLVSPPDTPLSIPMQSSLKLKVRFAPETIGMKAASLMVVTKSDDLLRSQFLLTGTAIRVISDDGVDYYSPVFNSLGMSFVYVPSGSFLMGSPEDEPGRTDDETHHEVRLTRGFYLQATPMTQGQWQGLMGSNPSSLINCGDDCPVERVSWRDCQGFIQKLNTLGEGTYRLPSEAEWEYACRAGSTTALSNGEITAHFCDPDPILHEIAWYCGNSDRQTHPVSQKRPNAWDLYDMHGNVLEWCQDWYGLYPLTAETDPVGAKSGSERVVRGGSWFSSAKTCRSACRVHRPPVLKDSFVGFRLVREP